MSDVVEKIISGNEYRHGRSVIRVSDGGLYTAGGRTGTVSPMSATTLELNLTDRFSSQDGTDDAITNLDSRSQTIGATAVPLTGLVEGAKIQIKASASNTGTIYIGPPGVTANTVPGTDGFPLGAGDGLYIPIVQTGIVHAIGSSANQQLFILEV